MMQDTKQSQTNRTILGVLLAILAVAILLALYSLMFGNDDGSSADGMPTPVSIPTSTVVPAQTQEEAAAPVATAPPQATPTAVPEGFEACSTGQAPVTTGTYRVDTNTTPLNQRAAPDVTSEQAGTFSPGTADLVFTGDCVINSADGYVWWEIFNGTEDVWIASDFVSQN